MSLLKNKKSVLVTSTSSSISTVIALVNVVMGFSGSVAPSTILPSTIPLTSPTFCIPEVSLTLKVLSTVVVPDLYIISPTCKDGKCCLFKCIICYAMLRWCCYVIYI